MRRTIIIIVQSTNTNQGPFGGNMQNDMMNYFNEISQNALKSANELIALNTRVLNETIERQVELGNVFVEGSKKQADLFKDTKDPKELVEKQTKLAEQYTAIFVEAAKENMAIAQRTGEDYKVWFENNAASVNQVAQKAAPKAAPRAAAKRKAG